MKADTLIAILKNPQQLQLSDLSMLTEVIDNYPYFQSARAVQLKGLKDQGSYLYNQKLKETAAYTTDREVLFNFITSKSFTITTASTTVEDSTTSNEPSPEEIESSTEAVTTEENELTTKEGVIKMTPEEASQIVDPLLFEAKSNTTSNIASAEEILEPNKPFEFNKKETHSFAEWLRLTTTQPINRTEIPTTKTKKKHIESSLIDAFIKNSPKISPINKSAPIVNLAKRHITPADDLMTETLAKVYVAQKNYKKAIQAYKILILKNPEKSGLFADRIRAIEKMTDYK
ncbi:hypothetical protein [Aquimarina agarivorans]|uniref:hypothetical protein n=1 Tax=Aquimarina agarivorans TaxID=980584 RepID=UPI000248FC9E|nr:hypothetical protein [Aquimarina agarivorans]